MAKGKILVVDDEPSVCEVISTRLALEGYEVDSVCDPRQALRKLHSGYDLVYTDIHMPGMDGEEFLKHVRRCLPDAGLVVVTGLPDTRQAVRLLKHGADDYLMKPLDLDTLAFSAKRAIEKRRLVKESARAKAALENGISGLREMQGQRQDFWDMAVHDLKNPLAQVMGRIEFFAERTAGSLDEAEMRDLSKSLEGCRQMLRLINNLLDMAKMESDTISVHLTRFDLNELASAAAENWAPAAKRDGLSVTSRLAAKPVEVLADRRMMERVFDNLVANAVEHAADGGWIRVSTFDDGLALCGGFAVANGGPGIPEEIRARIFEKHFSTSTGAGAAAGRGLGLAFCRKAIEQMGGQIVVAAPESGGTVFRADLPLTVQLARSAESELIAAEGGVK